MANKGKASKICWVVTDGKAGMVAQAMGIAEVLGLPIVNKTCSYRLPWSLFPPQWIFNAPRFMSKGSDLLESPWPDVLVSCGRQALGASIYVRKQSEGKCFTICVQDPRINSKYFDLIIPMAHDEVRAGNAIISNFSLHKITPERLAIEKDKFPLDNLQPPFFAILLGGSTHRYAMNQAACIDLTKQIQSILDNSQGTLLITPSRRTPAMLMQMLYEQFKGSNRVVIIDPSKNNPYLSMLAIADCIFVTDDSVNMVSEACATGSKVYILPLLGHVQGKSRMFVDNLLEKKIVELYRGSISITKQPIYNDTLRIAQEIKEILIAQRGFVLEDFNS